MWSQVKSCEGAGLSFLSLGTSWSLAVSYSVVEVTPDTVLRRRRNSRPLEANN